MASAGPLFAGTAANFNDGGNTAWTNPTNVQGDTTGTFASAAPASNGHITQQLRATNFGFDVPTEATIDGVVVEYERDGSNNNRFADHTVQLLAGGSLVGENRNPGQSWNNKVFQTVGAEDDLWGATLTPSIINAATFGVAIKGTRTASQTVTARLYRVQITVYYHLPAEEKTGSFTVTGGGSVDFSNQKLGQGDFAVSGGGSVSFTGQKIESDAELHEGSFTVSGGGGINLTPQKTAVGSWSVSGGGNLSIVGETERGGILIVTGGGSLSVEGTTDRLVQLLVSGGGEIGFTPETEREGSLTVSGGGSINFTGLKVEAGIVTGSFQVTGGGSVVFAVETERETSFQVSTGGGTSFLASTEREGSLQVSGGGSINFSGQKIEDAGPEIRTGTFSVSGGGGATFSTSTIRQVGVIVSGGGGVALMTGTIRLAAFVISGGGSIVFRGRQLGFYDPGGPPRRPVDAIFRVPRSGFATTKSVVKKVL